jgi:hypothetical protein
MLKNLVLIQGALPNLGILSWLYTKERCFKSRCIHHIYASCRGCILNNPALNQGIYTISRDLVMTIRKITLF